MSQSYPGLHGYYPGHPPLPPPMRRYRPLRRITTAFLVLAVLTVVVTIVQAVLMWRSYDEVKRFVYGLLSDDELDRAVGSIAGSGPLLSLMWMTFGGAGIVFLIWLWKARENTEFLASPYQDGQRLGGGPHRLDQGWVIGSWICPIVQFWYPLQVVEDVVRASEPEPGRGKTLLYSWWACWTAFWLIIVGGGSIAFVSILVWIVRVVDRAEVAEETGDYLDLYDLQSFMVGLAFAVNIAFTIATLLLVAAGATVVLLMYRTSAWQDARISRPSDRPAVTPPEYAPRPAFPSYTQRSPWQR